MSKLKSFKFIASLALIMGLTACGGASTADSSTKSTISSSARQLSGKWLSECISANANSSEIVMLSFTENNKGHQYQEASAVYDSANCTGKPSIVAFSGPVSFSGEFATSICTATKTDINLTSMIVGNTEFTGAVAQSFLNDVNITDPSYDIACQYREQLFIGQVNTAKDASSVSARPTTLNVMVAFDPYNSAPLNSSNKQSDLYNFYNDFKEFIKP